MHHMQHFGYGPVTPVAAYAMSFIGSLLGLRCAARARAGGGTERVSWLVLAALAIGGAGIWVMHFIAMLGFTVHGTEIRYDVRLTAASALIAIAIVGIGMCLVGFGGTRARILLPAGAITGAGVAVMHYSGMAAMNMPGNVSYDLIWVAVSVVIAVVAATAALWFSVRVRGLLATVGAAAVMGVAVSGMHYSGMAGMTVEIVPGLGAPSGATAAQLLLPSILAISVLTVVTLMIISLAPNETEMARTAEMQRLLRERRDDTPPAGTPPRG
ncbi:MHYT domain-containing protein [Actinomadura algeriensis]|uniref:NO-binding membrane sensor protein with MHYT domain n=1 Tax=Actinomadura algeriensis TaxID=1679523 RepID=A0ABR9JPH0_9ACTN|nr:MHYT domain-containing protein [Actinomadura algeriensis]MBE1532308.1 NO-binding membrane sensor protein with MHYT domain [Actinomadura algeriensis]